MQSPELYENYERGRKIIESSPHLYVDLNIGMEYVKVGPKVDEYINLIVSLGATSIAGAKFYREIHTKPAHITTYRTIKGEWEEWQKEYDSYTDQRTFIDGKDPSNLSGDLGKWLDKLKTEHNKDKTIFVTLDAVSNTLILKNIFRRGFRPGAYDIAHYSIRGLAEALRIAKGVWEDNAQNLRLPDDIELDGRLTQKAGENAELQQKIHYSLIGKIASVGQAAYQKTAESNQELEKENGTLNKTSAHKAGVYSPRKDIPGGYSYEEFTEIIG